MNKAELIEAVSTACDLPKTVAAHALETMFDRIVKAVASGEQVQLLGFGTFAPGSRAERTGRHPRTGEEIKIAAAKTIRFSAGKAFKEAVNK